jgi:hypothetical protein
MQPHRRLPTLGALPPAEPGLRRMDADCGRLPAADTELASAPPSSWPPHIHTPCHQNRTLNACACRVISADRDHGLINISPPPPPPPADAAAQRRRRARRRPRAAPCAAARRPAPPAQHYCNVIEAPWLVNGGHGASLRLRRRGLSSSGSEPKHWLIPSGPTSQRPTKLAIPPNTHRQGVGRGGGGAAGPGAERCPPAAARRSSDGPRAAPRTCAPPGPRRPPAPPAPAAP